MNSIKQFTGLGLVLLALTLVLTTGGTAQAAPPLRPLLL